MPQADVCSPWPVNLCCDTTNVDQADIDRWAAVASQVLFRLSGRRWGPSCPITVRPCRRSCLDAYPLTVGWGRSGPWIPYIGTDGAWRNASVCGCQSGCACGELCEVRLDGPVYDIVSIQDGQDVLAPEAYRLDGNILVRTDGECWPTCQDMAAPCGADGTLCVTYRTGLPLDESAIAAVSELTCHYLEGCSPSGSSCGCKTNPNLSRLLRQGVEIEMVDPKVLNDKGRTGLPLVDMWLEAVNPAGLTSPSRVYSPDYRRPRVTGR